MKFLLISLFLASLSTYGTTISLRHAANVIKLKGLVTVKSLHEKKVRKLNNKDPIFESDIIRTSENSLLRIKFKDNSILTVGPHSELEVIYFRKKPKKRNIIKLIQGQMRVWVREKSKGLKDSVIIKTKNASIGVRGTEFLTNTYLSAKRASTDLLVLEGRVLGQYESGEKLELKSGEYINSSYLGDGVQNISAQYLESLLKSKESLLPNLIDENGKLKTPKNIIKKIVDKIKPNLEKDPQSESSDDVGIDIQVEKKSSTKSGKGQKNSTEININIPTEDD